MDEQILWVIEHVIWKAFAICTLWKEMAIPDIYFSTNAISKSYQAVWPPSIRISAAVMNLLASLSRYTAAPR